MTGPEDSTLARGKTLWLFLTYKLVNKPRKLLKETLMKDSWTNDPPGLQNNIEGPKREEILWPLNLVRRLFAGNCPVVSKKQAFGQARACEFPTTFVSTESTDRGHAAPFPLNDLKTPDHEQGCSVRLSTARLTV